MARGAVASSGYDLSDDGDLNGSVGRSESEPTNDSYCGKALSAPRARGRMSNCSKCSGGPQLLATPSFTSHSADWLSLGIFCRETTRPLRHSSQAAPFPPNPTH